MRPVRRSTTLLILLLGLSLVAAACGGGGGKKSTGGVASGGGTPVVGGMLTDLQNFSVGEPDHIDPNLVTDTEGSQPGELIWDGLTETDYKTGKLIPNVAESWTHNADFTEWTFKIRQGVKFSNGDPVLPSSFVFSWNRLVSAALASKVAYHVADALQVVGAKDVQDGKAATMSGLTADDANLTLTMKLQASLSFADAVVSHLALSPLDEKDPNLKGADTTKYEQGLMIGDGPYMLAEPWKHNQSITLVRNPNYWGGPNNHKPYIDKIVFVISKDEDSAFTAFESGQGDTGLIPQARFTEAKAKYAGHISDGPLLGIYDWGFNMKDPVVGGAANLKLRQAIAYAIDKDAMIKTTYNGSREKATGWTPPGVPGYKAGLDQYAYDVSKAKSTLADWEKDTGKKAADLPPIKLNFNSGAGHDTNASIIQSNLQAIGIKSELDGRDSTTYFDDMAAGKGQFLRSGWNLDYVTYDNALFPIFDTASIGSDNLYQYSNKQFDDLIDKARRETGESAYADYRAAEDLAINKDVVAVPLNWYKGGVVYATRVHNAIQSPLNFLKYEDMWLSK